MDIIPIWSASAKDLVREIVVGDINSDGVNEVIYASWDGSVYAVRGDNGNRVWIAKTSPYDEPAERLLLLKLNGLTIDHVGVTKHKKLIILDGLEGKRIWMQNLDSWIMSAIACDIDSDGRDEIAVITRKGQFYIVNDDGEILLRRNIQRPITKNIVTCSDIDGDRSPEIILGGKKLMGIKSDGSLILSVKLSSPILSVTKGKILNTLEPAVVAGADNELLILHEKGKLHAKIENIKPVIIVTGDVDGDLQEEIIIGDWKTNSIRIFKIKMGKILEKSTIKMKSNVLHILCKDIDGDGKDEILAITDDLKNNFIIVRGNGKLLYISDSYNASLGLSSGNILGYGDSDIILRTSREKISALICVPRINMPKIVREKTQFSILTAMISGDKIRVSDGLRIKKMIKGPRLVRKKNIMLVKYEAIANKYGKYKVKLVRGNKSLVSNEVIVASDKLFPETRAICIHDEDLIELKGAFSEARKVVPKAEVISIYNKEERVLHVSAKRTGIYRVPIEILLLKGNLRRKTKISPLVVIDSAISANISLKKYYAPQDNLILSLQNRSRKKIKVRVISKEPLKPQDEQIIIKSKTSIDFDIKIRSPTDKYYEEVRSFLKIIYGDKEDHIIVIPVNIKIVNVKKIQEAISELKEVDNDREELLSILGDKTRVPREILNEII